MKKITRVALITSGGDCQGLNAAMRGIGKALHNKVENLEIFGMYDGYRGLVDGDYKFMEPKDFAGILTQGGTILGTSRQRYIPGKDIVDENGNSLIPAMKDTYNRLNLDCLVIMGGNGEDGKASAVAAAVIDCLQNCVYIIRYLGYEDYIRARADACVQRKPACVAAHKLNDEHAAVR